MQRSYLPMSVTLANLILGVSSVKLAIQGNYQGTVALIITAMLLDFFDGKIARKLNAETDFGKELDSLSDLVSFGVSPAVLTWLMFSEKSGQSVFLYVSIIFFVVSGALRLARYNVRSEFTSEVEGLPITAAGGILSVITLHLATYSPFLLSMVTIFLACLMVSRFPVSFNNIYSFLSACFANLRD